MKKILLPKLKRIELIDYSLYVQQPSFQFEFEDGINAIVGVNGIGKTTFIELIMYSLIGFEREYKTKNINGQKIIKSSKETNAIDYFKSRFNKNFNSNHNAKVILEFSVGETIFKITRSLYQDEIISLEIDGKDLNIQHEEEYEQFILEKTRLSNFKSLQTLIRKFLLFDEQRLNVAWETETQDEILRILFFDEEMFKEFDRLENLVTELDSKGRHKSEDRRIVKERYTSLIYEKEQLIQSIERNESNMEDVDYIKLIETKNKLDIEIETINEKIEELSGIAEEKNKDLDRLIGERNNINQELEHLVNDISKIESKIYNSIYKTLPDYYLSIEKSLINDGECLVCNSKSKELKEKFSNNRKHKKCVICESELQEETNVDDALIDELNQMADYKNTLITRLKNKEDEIRVCKELWQDVNETLKDLVNQKGKSADQILHIDSILAERGKNDNHDTYSQIIQKLDMEDRKLTEEINLIYKDRDCALAELNNLQKRFVNIIDSLNADISTFFNKYASTFIGLDCELTVKQQKIKRVPHIKYLPRVNGDERSDIYSVSESQRFFLDQAFRMAIIDYLQNTISGFQTFFITETPEGSLDIAYEEHVAKMFLLFAEYNNNIIFTSNLNSSRFLKKIFNDMNTVEKKRRVLNMLEKGNLTAVQQKNINEIERIINNLLGDEEQ